MARAKPVKRILIVGGGTAGWMAALYLNRTLQRVGCSVSLVESKAIGTIGVGEATIPSLVHFIRSLGLDEHELMQRCSATYKLGIHFEGWGGVGHTYWHPFGGAAQIANLDLYHFWLRGQIDRPDSVKYSDYALQALLAEANKGPAASIRKHGTYAYHLDALALAEYFRDLAVGEGVRHHYGTIGAVDQNEDGNITSVEIGDDRRIEADLFVDASGFSGCLIEKTLADPWIDWSRFLLCDRAIAMPLPVDEIKAPFTRSIAGRAGWMWRIPLTSRTGYGYVYSSAHTTDEQAAKDLIDKAKLPKHVAVEPRFLTMRVGRRTQFWKNNCVSIGLASGFVEPLESTGIHLSQKAVQCLVEHFPDIDMAPALRDAFNEKLGRAFDEVRDFIVLHYVAAKRYEPFWFDARDPTNLPESLRSFLAIYDVCGLIDRKRIDLFPESSYHYVLGGCDRRPARPITTVDVLNPAVIADVLRKTRAGIVADCAQTPSHADAIAFLRRRAS